MADTANEKNVLPSFDGKSPKEMRRAWLRFMADHDWAVGSAEYIQAEYVRLSIECLILNDGSPAELWAQKALEQQLAAFSQIWAVRRG